MPSYQWKRNNVNIAGATNSSYTPVDDDDQKNLTVVFTPDTGSPVTSPPVYVTYPAPTFTTQPTMNKLSYSFGEIVTLNLGATANPTTKTVEVLTLNGVDKRSELSGNFWQAPEIEGTINFRVRATNSGGSVLSNIITATLVSNAPTPAVPGFTITDTLVGRTLTLTVGSVTGVPAPTFTISMNVSGTAVTPNQVSSTVWTYTVPSNTLSRVVNWTITGTNTTGTLPQSGSRTIPADIATPVVVASFQNADYFAGDTINAASLVRTITLAGTPALVDAGLTSTLLVNGVSTSLPYTVVAGVTLVHRITATHPTGNIQVDSASKTALSNSFYFTVANDGTADLDGTGSVNLTITSPTHLATYNGGSGAGVYPFTMSALSTGPIALFNPVITGTPANGQTLSILHQPFAVTNSVATIAYQWQKNGTNISGATNQTFDITGAVNGDAYRLSAVITDTNGSTAAIFSNALTVSGGVTPTINSVTYDAGGILVDYTGTLDDTIDTGGLNLEIL
jgi:hypothetical protein